MSLIGAGIKGVRSGAKGAKALTAALNKKMGIHSLGSLAGKAKRKYKEMGTVYYNRKDHKK